MNNLPLDLYGMLYGTDKSSLGMNYLGQYDRALSRFRDDAINLVEIGVHDGASVKMWKAFFPNARIIGIDIQERCKSFEEDRISIEIGSQADPDFMRSVLTKYPPTILIDDGSHQADHIIASWEIAFEHVVPGGCYIIEDLFFHEGEEAILNRGAASLGAQDYVLTYAKQLLDGHIHSLHHDGIGARLHHQIDRIEALRGVALVWKAHQAAADHDFAFLELIAERSGRAMSWYLLGVYTMKVGGPLDLVEKAVLKAVDANPSEWAYLNLLATVYERRGNISEAIRVVTAAIAIGFGIWKTRSEERLAELTKRLS